VKLSINHNSYSTVGSDNERNLDAFDGDKFTVWIVVKKIPAYCHPEEWYHTTPYDHTIDAECFNIVNCLTYKPTDENGCESNSYGMKRPEPLRHFHK